MGRRAADCWLWMMKLLSSAPANSTRTSYSNKAGARSPSSHTLLPFMFAHSPGSPGEKWIWIKRADIKQCRGQAARDWAGNHLGGATHSDLDDQKMQKNVTTKNSFVVASIINLVWDCINSLCKSNMLYSYSNFHLLKKNKIKNLLGPIDWASNPWFSNQNNVKRESVYFLSK